MLSNIWQTLLGLVDGPIVSRAVGAVVGAIMGILAQHVALDAGQTQQFQSALTTIVTLIVYAATHNGIKGLSAASGNAIVAPAGTAK